MIVEPMKALQAIMAAAERALLPKQDHVAVEQAYKVLEQILNPKPVKEDDKKPKEKEKKNG